MGYVGQAAFGCSSKMRSSRGNRWGNSRWQRRSRTNVCWSPASKMTLMFRTARYASTALNQLLMSAYAAVPVFVEICGR